MDCYDCIVIGGGISGISFAHYLSKKDKKVLLLEKENNFGGQIKSSYYKNDASYWFELGAHTCYNSYTHLLDIVQDLGLEDNLQVLDKGSYVIYNEKIVSPMKELSLISLIFNGPKLLFSSRSNKTVEEYFKPIVGRKNYEHLFRRMFRAVISQEADHYPAEMFLKRRNGRYKQFPRKLSFKGGLQQFIQLILDKSDFERKSEAEILSITKEDDYYKLVSSDGKVYYSKKIALATSPSIASNLLNDINGELSTLLASISSVESESMNVVVNKNDLDLKIIAGIISLSDDFMSAVSRDLVAHPNFRSFTFHFQNDKYSREEKIDLITEVLNIPRSAILDTHETVHSLPALQLNHLPIVKEIDNLLRNDIYLLGNYFYGLSIEDCIQRSKEEAARFE